MRTSCGPDVPHPAMDGHRCTRRPLADDPTTFHLHARPVGVPTDGGPRALADARPSPRSIGATRRGGRPASCCHPPPSCGCAPPTPSAPRVCLVLIITGAHLLAAQRPSLPCLPPAAAATIVACSIVLSPPCRCASPVDAPPPWRTQRPFSRRRLPPSAPAAPAPPCLHVGAASTTLSWWRRRRRPPPPPPPHRGGRRVRRPGRRRPSPAACGWPPPPRRRRWPPRASCCRRGRRRPRPPVVPPPPAAARPRRRRVGRRRRGQRGRWRRCGGTSWFLTPTPAPSSRHTRSNCCRGA